MVTGDIAVEIFFIISGFYMAMVLSEKYCKIEKKRFWYFISNRLLRLFPVYWVVLILTLLTSILYDVFFDLPLKLEFWNSHISDMSISAILVQVFSNIFLLGQDVLMFFGFDRVEGVYFTENFRNENIPFYKFLLIPQAWSLSIELIFYFMAPIVVFLSNFWLGFIFTLSLGVRLFLHYSGIDNDPWSYRFAPSELMFFFGGIFCYRFYSAYMVRKNALKGKYLLSALSCFYLASIIFYNFIPGTLSLKKNIFYLISFLAIPILFVWTKNSRLDRKIGEYSYPIYIVHLLVVYGLQPLVSGLVWKEWGGELTSLISIVISFFLIKCVSDRIEAVRQSRLQTE